MAAAVSSWSAEDAVDYLVRVSGVARSKAELDVRRIITFPGQAAAPQYGHLKLNMLRRLAQSAIGITRLALFNSEIQSFRVTEQSLKVSKLSPFVLGKALRSAAGSIETVKRLRNGDFLREVASAVQSRMVNKLDNLAG